MKLQRSTAVDALAGELRRRILDGDLAPGTPLREVQLTADYDVARHTARAALRALEHQGLAIIETHRGARVRALDLEDLQALGELRIALETEAARLALARHGRLPAPVHDALDRLGRAERFAAIAEAHDDLHHAIVAAAQSPRIAAAHRALSGELRLFLVQLRPAWDTDGLVAEHARLVADIERDGPDAVRRHIEASTRALIAHAS